MPPLTRRRRPHTPPRGLTLIEVLIALALAGIIGTVLLTTLTSQQRLYAALDTRTRVQRNLRTGVSVLPADLRSASPTGGGGDLVALQDAMVQLRATIGSSVVCGIPASTPRKTQIDLPPLNASANVFSTWYTPPVVGDTVWVYDENVNPTPADDRWTPYKITAFAQAPTASGSPVCPTAAFLDPVKDAASALKPRWRVTLSDTLADSVRVGAGVRFTRQVRYSLFSPPGAATAAPPRAYIGYAEQGASGMGAPDVLAGPFHAYAPGGGGGLAFTYFDSTGAAIAAPVSAGDLPRVARVDVVLRSVMQFPRSADTLRAARDSAVFRIALRNRQ